MKKFISILLALTLLFALSACGNSDDTETNGGQTPSEQGSNAQNDDGSDTPTNAPSGDSGKALVVYFSATGNTETVAKAIADAQSADIYEITPERAYTAEDLNYNDRSSRATAEQNDDSARPAISGTLSNLDDYDVIFIGYPIWWGDMPRILYTFFDAYDFSGKTIAPFCTSGGSGLSGTPRTIASLESGATVLDGLHVNDSSVSGAASAVSDWISDLGI